MVVLPIPPQAQLQQFFTHLCMCACVCVCERESVCSTIWNSAEICVAIRKLEKIGDLGRPACGDFGCYYVLDAFCPLTLLAAHFSCWSRVCACVAARMSLHVYSSVLCGCRWLCLVCRGSHESSCEKKEKENERERHSEWEREREWAQQSKMMENINEWERNWQSMLVENNVQHGSRAHWCKHGTVILRSHAGQRDGFAHSSSVAVGPRSQLLKRMAPPSSAHFPQFIFWIWDVPQKNKFFKTGWSCK